MKHTYTTYTKNTLPYSENGCYNTYRLNRDFLRPSFGTANGDPQNLLLLYHININLHLVWTRASKLTKKMIKKSENRYTSLDLYHFHHPLVYLRIVCRVGLIYLYIIKQIVRDKFEKLKILKTYISILIFSKKIKIKNYALYEL